MKTSIKFYLVYVLLAGIVLIGMSSCGSLTGFQDAKTLGKKQKAEVYSFSALKQPIFGDNILDIFGSDLGSINDLPTLEYFYRYGLSKKVDINFRCNSNMGVSGGCKIQFIGDKNSKFAMASGLELSSFFLFSNLFQISFPLYFSYQFDGGATIYCSPKLNAFKFLNLGEANFNYFSANVGFISTAKKGVIVDLGLYRLETNHNRHQLFITLGVGFEMANRKPKPNWPEFPLVYNN